MLILSPSTVCNPEALDFRTAPRPLLGRIAILPSGGAAARDVLRLVVESQVLRFSIALLPFVIALAIWPQLALPIAQAPLAMLIVIGFVELRVLRLNPEQRAALSAGVDADILLNTLGFRAEAILRRIAASRDMTEGELYLVIDQSELARISPLTVVTVQLGPPVSGVLDLDPTERAQLTAALFDADLSEEKLHAVNLATDTFHRSFAFDARGVSAHARLAARLGRPDAPGAVRT